MNPKNKPVVINYNSKSYESVLFRSPNSPPPSPSPLPPPSVAYLNHLFFSSSLRHSCNPSFLLPSPPPLLPLPLRSSRSTQTKQKAKRNRSAAAKNKVTEKEERRLESVRSPPPSSLPLPRFSMRRTKAATSGGEGVARSCIAEAAKGVGGGRDYHELMQMRSIPLPIHSVR